MKAVPYSPFNKTYKYLSLQHQLAHTRNTKNSKGLVDSNLKIQKNNNTFSHTFKTNNKFNKTFNSHSSLKN